MKKGIKELFIAGLLALSMNASAYAVESTIRQPIAGGGGAATLTTTSNGTNNMLDVNLPAGSISVGAITVNPFNLVTGEFKSCTIPPTSAASCNLAATSTAWLVFNGSTANAIWINPYGTAAANTGFPLTKSGVAYDHSFGLMGMSVKNFSIYNADSATSTVLLWGGK